MWLADPIGGAKINQEGTTVTELRFRNNRHHGICGVSLCRNKVVFVITLV